MAGKSVGQWVKVLDIPDRRRLTAQQGDGQALVEQYRCQREPEEYRPHHRQ